MARTNDPANFRKLGYRLIVIVTVILISGLTQAARAQETEFSGYLKTLLAASKTFFDEGYYLVLHRLRTQLVIRPKPYAEIVAALDNQLRWGSFLDTAQYAIARPLEDSNYVDLAINPLDNTNAQWRSELYRFYFRATGQTADFAIGRQRIAWGTGRIWNPTDLFNPVSPLQIEPAEKRGADAVYLALRPGGDLQLEFAGAVGENEDDTRFGARAGTTIGSYDISLMTGRFRDSDVVGFDFSGYIGDAGFRGEFTHTWETDRNFWRGVLSFEYAFRNGLILLTEYLYNGGNIADFSVDNLEDLAAFDSITTLNRHFLAVQLSQVLHPLVYFNAMTIGDLEDGSVFMFPSLSYSWLQNVDIVIGAQLFLGNKGDFSYMHPASVFAVEWYF